MIAFVGGTFGGDSGNAISSLNFIYNVVSGGNAVVIGASFLFNPGGITNVVCKDNFNVPLTLVASQGNGGNGVVYLWYGTTATGTTSYTISWATNLAHIGVVLGEYSGVSGNPGLTNIGATGTNFSSSNTNPLTISLTTTGANSFVVAALGNSTSNRPLGAPIVGNDREDGNGQPFVGGTQGICFVELVDNTAATSGTSVTCSTTSTNAAAPWAAVAVELLAPSTAIRELCLLGAGT